MAVSLLSIISPNWIEQILSEALAGGGDFAEIYGERSSGTSVSLEEKQVKHASFGKSVGVGIRVLKGSEVGYAYSDDLDLKQLLKTARVAGAIARSGGAKSPIDVSPVKTPSRYPFTVDPNQVAICNKVAMLREGSSIAHGLDKRIQEVMGSIVDAKKEILIANSEGLLAEDERIMCRLNFVAVAMDNTGERRTGSHGGGGRVGFEFFDEFSPDKVAKEAARMAIAQMGAIEAPAGQQTVVLSPGWSGILLHEAVGHGLEADFIKKGTSLYTGQLGEKVASDLCTVIDSGTPLNRRGSLNVDDEGRVPEENVLIEKGILKGYLSDKISAQEMNISSTGSGRRQNYRYAPMPRMTNTFMAAGPHTHDEIMSSVQNGIYCASFGGGQVDISNGNFVFEVREGYVIEDGKLTNPVKNATLIGLGPETLKNVSMVADNPELDPGIGTCGKDGQSVPVGVGMPTIRI
ncbi:MAG: metallopeptidase TldD-related protein, partial [Myxococcota bacterium]|nr:metallopeptidase TldD-related protein [Myxococcota bacterium]